MKAMGQDIRKPTFMPSENITILAPPPPPVEIVMTNPDVKKTISVEEYKAISSSSADPAVRKPLFIVKGEVYDGTGFMQEHPGGADSIWLAAGELDATEDFMAIHSDDAKKKLIPVSKISHYSEILTRVSDALAIREVPHWHTRTN